MIHTLKLRSKKSTYTDGKLKQTHKSYKFHKQESVQLKLSKSLLLLCKQVNGISNRHIYI